MQYKKKVEAHTKIDYSKYVNSETGESLDSELKGKTTITAKEGTNHYVINSDDYVVFDSAAIEYLMQNLNNSDMAHVVKISKMVKTDCSVLFQPCNLPHSAETLSVTLDMELSSFYKFVSRLVKKGILAYCVCAPSGYVQKIYILNPYIARKRKTVNCFLFEQIFKHDIVNHVNNKFTK